MLPDGFTAHDGAVLNVNGGSTAGDLMLLEGSATHARGGVFADGLHSYARSSLNFWGGEFRIDGVPVEATDPVAVVVPEHGMISGTLSDGAPFAFSRQENPSRLDGDIVLYPTPLPAVGPALVTASTDPVPQGIRAGQTLVVDDGGVVGDNFNAGWGSTVNIEPGGYVGTNLEAVGATVNMSGGESAGALEIFRAAVLNMTGGVLNPSNDIFSGGRANISGGQVPLLWVWRDASATISGDALVADLQVFSGASITVDESALVSRLFTGTPRFNPNDHTIITIHGGRVLGDVSLRGAGAITISGGEVDSVGVGRDVVFEMSGGQVGRISPNAGTTRVSGGTISRGFWVRDGAVVEVSGGSIGRDTFVEWGGSLTVLGGTFDDNFQAHSGSNVHITGGAFGERFVANSGSAVHVEDATIAGRFTAAPGSDVTVVNSHLGDDADFNDGVLELNGQDIGANFRANEATIVINGGAVSDYADFQRSAVTIRNASVGRDFRGYFSEVNIADSVIGRNFRAENAPAVTLAGVASPGQLIVSGDRVEISGAAIGDNVSVDTWMGDPGPFGSIVNSSFGDYTTINGFIEVSGTSFGDAAALTGPWLTLVGESLGDHASFGGGGELTLLDGAVGRFFSTGDAIVDIAGGTIGDGYNAGAARVNMTGGSVGQQMRLGAQAAFTMSGGSVGEMFTAPSGSQTHLIGTEFFIDGEPIEGLMPGQRTEIDERYVTLTGRLADGSPFDFELLPLAGGSDRFDRSATVTITLFDGLLGDFNADGAVDAGDYTAWRDTLGQFVTPGAGADHNFSGRVDDGDYYVWRNQFGGGDPAALLAPEPTGGAMVLVLVASVTLVQRIGARAD